MPGVVLSQNVSRYYPYGQFLTQVLGFTTVDNIGQAGVEAYYNDYLKGVNGKNLSQGDAGGVIIEGLDVYIPSIDGLDIKLTIDSKIQNIIETALYNIMQDHKPKSASIIMLDVASGDVLGLGISPSYDSNFPPRDDVTQLMELTKNTAVVDVYEPGSTFKILTVAAALEENLVSENEHFYCPGYRIIDGQKIKCWRTIGHGSQTLSEGIANSCNCVFMDLALRLGKEKLYRYLKLFGIGSKTGVDIMGESSGLLMDIESVKTVDLARIGFGQAVAVTQLQLINAFCSVINGGYLTVPKLLNGVYKENNIIKENGLNIKNYTISQKTSNKVNKLLKDVLSIKNGEGTFVAGYDIGGKTGVLPIYYDIKLLGEIKPQVFFIYWIR
jgi:stage V sporulation protein D (sporulation-specific penicillin-binding protein)